MTCPITTTSPSVLAIPEVRPGATNPEIVAWIRTKKAPARAIVEMPPAVERLDVPPEPIFPLQSALAFASGILLAAAFAWIIGAPL